jgi:transcriptional regulator with PAS, ATPase and Fis domain
VDLERDTYMKKMHKNEYGPLPRIEEMVGAAVRVTMSTEESEDEFFDDIANVEPEILTKMQSMWERQAPDKPYPFSEVKSFCGELIHQHSGSLEDSLMLLFRSDNEKYAFFVKDLSMKYVYVNAAMEKFLGLPASEIIGKNKVDSLEDCALQDPCEEAIRTGSHWRRRVRCFSRRNKTFLELYVPRKDEQGSVNGVFGIITQLRVGPPASRTFGHALEDQESRPLKDIEAQCDFLAQFDFSILLLGESGTGKDFWARHIHDHSSRSNCEFLSQNCAAIPETLGESSLFGHERGAFTGALKRTKGLLEQADGGTLFLNEIGELSPALQAKLLSFLDERTIKKVGGDKSIKLNVRLIAATNKNLQEEMTKGTFRHDLFHRLNVFVLELPPLRQRLNELPALIENLLHKIAVEIGISIRREMDAQLLQKFRNYSWPGNVRELKTVLEQWLVLGPKMVFPPKDSFHKKMEDFSGQDDTWSWVTQFPQNKSYKEVWGELKTALIIEAMRRAPTKEHAARLLGMPREVFHRQIKKLKIDVT